MDRQPEPEWMDDAQEAQAYAETDFSEVNADFVEKLLRLGDAIGGARVLDLGCGPGDIACRAAASRPGWRVVGADASAAMLRHARKAAGAQAAWVLADAKRCPFPDGAFDIIISNSILHHMPGPLPFWREVRRLAAPGAIVFLRDLFRPATPNAARTLVQQYARGETPLLQEEFYRSFLAAFTPEEISAQLASTGLDMLHVETVTDRHVDIVGRKTWGQTTGFSLWDAGRHQKP